MCAGSRFIRIRIQIIGVPTRLNYWAIFILYPYLKRGHGPQNTTWRAAGWRPLPYSFLHSSPVNCSRVCQSECPPPSVYSSFLPVAFSDLTSALHYSGDSFKTRATQFTNLTRLQVTKRPNRWHVIRKQQPVAKYQPDCTTSHCRRVQTFLLKGEKS